MEARLKAARATLAQLKSWRDGTAHSVHANSEAAPSTVPDVQFLELFSGAEGNLSRAVGRLGIAVYQPLDESSASGGLFCASALRSKSVFLSLKTLLKKKEQSSGSMQHHRAELSQSQGDRAALRQHASSEAVVFLQAWNPSRRR